MLQIQELVAKIGVQTTEYLLNTMRDRGNLKRAYVASMPQIRCTLPGYKYMLQPGAQNHPDNLTNPVLRNPTITCIAPAPGELLSICIHSGCHKNHVLCNICKCVVYMYMSSVNVYGIHPVFEHTCT